MVEIRLVLVAIDFSDISETVMDYADNLARAWGARLLVVHVVHDLSDFTSVYATGTSLLELQQQFEEEASERLEAICQTELSDALPYETLLRTGRPAIEINQIIHQHGVDCLIIGGHSTDKPEHQLFGSTSQRLLHQAACPIFMIPPRKTSEFISHG
jgi:nucleotide-binding universal stress UspA family protein